MPPCKNVLKRKIDRVKILTMIIKKASQQAMNIQLTNGWYVNENGKMEIEYFEGNPYPSDVAEVTINESNDANEEEENDNYISESDESDAYESDDN